MRENIISTSHEVPAKKEIEYPLGYFEAQVRFACKWAELSGDDLAETLKTKTALYRRITNGKPPAGEEVWQAATAVIAHSKDPEYIAGQMYQVYLTQPHSAYEQPSYPENDGKHFGYFSFDYYPANSETGEKPRIKVHFINQQRGEKSGLDPAFLAQRQADLKRMFEFIKNNYPEAVEVIGGSWLYALKSYRDSFPPEFTTEMKRLVPKGFDHIPNSVARMSFEGNSVWGQFLDRRGGVRQHVYDQFVQNVSSAQTLEDLVNTFPNVPYQPKVPITVFYEWMKETE